MLGDLMEEQILRNFETFEEIPEGLLELKEGSNLIYIRYDREVYVAREFFDSVISDNLNVIYTVSYLDVRDNKNILTLLIKKSLVDNSIEFLNKREDINIIPLNEVLSIKGNKCFYIGLDDINIITKYKGDDPVQKGKKVNYI